MAELMVHVGLGWGVFKCGIKGQYLDFGMPISYTTNAPMETLDAICTSLHDNKSLHLEYDAEDKGFWSIDANDERVIATREEETGTISYELDITKKALMKQLVSDIMDDVDGWANFCFDEENMIENKKSITIIGSKCLTLLKGENHGL